MWPGTPCEEEIVSDEALRRNTRLSARLVLNAVLVVLAMGLFYGAYHVYRLRAAAVDAAADRLELRALVYAERIAAVFRTFETDAAKLARYPPIAALMRIDRAGNGTDPFSDVSGPGWKDRLALLFEGEFAVNPHFFQMRLISARDGWQELVRVERQGSRVVRVPRMDLQPKGGEPYLAAIQADPQSAPYFSRVTRNREHGHASGPAALRYVHPLHDQDGVLFGVIVINADFERLMQEARPRMADGNTAVVVTGQGDHVTFGQGTGAARFGFHDDPDFSPLPQTALLAHRRNLGHAVPFGDDLAFAYHVPNGILHPSFDLFIITLESTAALRRASLGVLVRQIGMAVLLALLAGAVTQFMATELTTKLRNITELFRRKSARLSWIIHNAADGLITIRDDGTIEHINPAAEAMFGYTSEEAAGQPLGLLMPAEMATEHQSFVERSSVGERSERMGRHREIFGRRRDGSSIDLEISVSRAAWDGKVKFIGQVRDISRRRKTERQMEQLVEDLRRSNAELDQFAYVASHDLKAPLRVIQNASQWLADDLAPHLDDDTRETLGLLQNRAARMECLLNDLLEHSRIGSRAHPAEMITGTRLLEELRALINLPEGIRFSVTGPFATETLPRMPLKVVLLNLLCNAIKHHDRPEGQVQLSLRPTPGGWAFEVTDDGPGIAPRYHEKVFQIFQTLRPRDEVEGSGMGLAIVRKHVEVAGGRITLESDGQRGTTFHLFWPHPKAHGNEDIAA